MVIRPWVMPHATIYRFIGIACAFGAKLPYGPVFTVFRIEEFDELVERVSVGELGICF
jgi:hypothetical protein